jgi:hypothetical protein
MTILCSPVIAPDLPRAVVTELIGFLPFRFTSPFGSGTVVSAVMKSDKKA